jgi:hypothetical protein
VASATRRSDWLATEPFRRATPFSTATSMLASESSGRCLSESA